MYKQNKLKNGTLRVNKSTVGETIETKMSRVFGSNAPISDGAETIYTERKDGVLPQYDPRHDKWLSAIDGHDQRTQANLDKRKEGIEKKFPTPKGESADGSDKTAA